MTYPNILAEIHAKPWAMTTEAIQGLRLAVAGQLRQSDFDRFHGAEPGEFDSFTQSIGQPPANDPDNGYVRIDGSTGYLLIDGPIVPRSNSTWKSSGINSIQQMAASLRSLEANPDIKQIVLFLDSPGGAVTGVSDFAKQVRESKKETTAYVFGMAASAGYWIASQADKIVSVNSGMVGSIGVVSSFYKDEDLVELVSSQSPYKRVDEDDKEGRATIQTTLDDLAEIFIQDVAEGRGVSVDTVKSDFGKGAMFVANRAKSAGMVDDIMTLEEFQNSMKSTGAQVITNTGGGTASINQGEANMDLQTLRTEHPALYAEVVGIGVNQERDRASAHLDMGAAFGAMDAAVEAVQNGADLSNPKVVAAYHIAQANKTNLANAVDDNPSTPTAPAAPVGADNGEDLAAQVDKLVVEEMGANGDMLVEGEIK